MARNTPKRKAAARAVEKSKVVLTGMDSEDDEAIQKVIYDSYTDSDDGFKDDEPASEAEDEEEEAEVSMPSPPPNKRRRTGTFTSVATRKQPTIATLKTPARRLRALTGTPATASTVTSKTNSVSDGSSPNEDWLGVDTPATAASISNISSVRSTRSRSGNNVEIENVQIFGLSSAFDDDDDEDVMQATVKGKGKAKTSVPSRTKKNVKKVEATSANLLDVDSDDDDEDFEIPDSEEGLSELDTEEEKALEAVFGNASGLEDSDGDDRPARRARPRGPRVPRAERERKELHSRHPYLKTLWDDMKTYERIKVEKAAQPEGLSLTMLPFQLEGLNWLTKQEKTRFHGGILADEMGMGKTIQTIALLMIQPRQKPNLVVAPTVALLQWKSEIEKHTNGALKVRVYHSNEKTDNVKELTKVDVILTTYNVLESGFRHQTTGWKRKGKDGEYYMHKEPSTLHKVKYHRVILDEAHNIKDRSCNTARAVFQLQTKNKLCLSGTPLQNRIGELFSLLRFLEADPFSMYFCRKCDCKSMHWKFSDRRNCDQCNHRPMDHMCWFNYELLRPIQNFGNTGAGKVAFENLQTLLSLIMLRRTKIERADDLGLPPRIVKVRRDYFNEEELDLYDSIYGQSKRKFNTYVAQGVVLNNYANIFTLITRMRQLADHPDLVLKKHSEEGQNNLVCVICDEEAEEAIKSKCHHTFCRMCVQKYIDTFAGEGDPECPTCHIPLSIDLTQPAMEMDYDLVKKGSIVNRIDMANWRSSTKIEALVEELAKLRNKSQTIKSIVFSQFTSMLQLVEWRLRKAGFLTVMLEGSMSPTQRAASIEYFMNNASVEVFLVSLKAGGVALNLVEASQVFIMDPWWNPSVEWQSGDRIHRIGQTRNCRITRLVIEDSIESRIIELQEKKANMINATVGNDQTAMEKLSAGDLQFLFMN